MAVALIFLAVASVVVGFIPFSQYVSADGTPYTTHIHWEVAALSVAIAVAGIGLAAWMYLRPGTLADRLANAMPGLYKWSKNKFYIDEIYLWVTRTLIFKGLAWPNGMAWATAQVSEKIKGLQSGQLQQYAYAMVLGAVAFLLLLLYWGA